MIREAYVASFERDDPPSIPDLCRAHANAEEATVKQVRRAASKENWEAHRVKRRVKLNTVLEKREDAMIERVVDEMLKKREEFLRDAIAEVEDYLPPMLEELKARIETGFFDDKALVQAIKLLIDSRKSVLEIIQKEFHHQDKQKDKQVDRELGLLKDLGLLSKIADVIEGRIDPGTIDTSAMDRTMAHEDAQTKALELLDAEVVGD